MSSDVRNRRVSIAHVLPTSAASDAAPTPRAPVRERRRTSDGFDMILDGLAPEIAAAVEELAQQVVELGYDLTPQSVEAASHHGDKLYRAFIEAGAQPNEISNELEISLGQFYRYIRPHRALTQNDLLTAMVDVNLSVQESAEKLPNRKMMLLTSSSMSSPTTVRGGRRVPAAAPSEGGTVPSGEAPRLTALEHCRLNFNQISALIRHHTGGPAKRLRTASASPRMAASPPVPSASATRRPSVAALGGGAASSPPQHRREESAVSATSSAAVAAAATSASGAGEEDVRVAAEDVVENGESPGLASVDDEIVEQRRASASDAHPPGSAKAPASAPTETPAPSEAATSKQQTEQQQASSAHGGGAGGHEKHYARGKGGFVSHAPAQSAAVAPTANLFAWQEQLEEQKRRQANLQQQQQQEDFASGDYSPPASAAAVVLPLDEPVENEFDGDFGEQRRRASVSKLDEMLARIERASQSPQRVHGAYSGRSDSVVPPYMRPGAKVHTGFGATTSPEDAAMMDERERRLKSPEKRVRLQRSGLPQRTADERFRDFSEFQERQERRGQFSRGASRPTSACAMRTEFNHAKLMNMENDEFLRLRLRQQQTASLAGTTASAARPGSAVSRASTINNTSNARFTPAPPSQNTSRNGAATAQQQQSRPHAKRPAAFGYYDWFLNTNRSLPQSAYERGYGRHAEGEQHRPTSASCARPESRMAGDIPTTQEEDDDEYDGGLDRSFNRRNAAASSRPTSATAPQRPGTAMSSNGNAGGAASRPGTATGARGGPRPGSSMSASQQGQQRTATPFFTPPTRSVVDTIPVSLLPERADVHFAKLHPNGVAYMVRPVALSAASTAPPLSGDNNTVNGASGTSGGSHRPLSGSSVRFATAAGGRRSVVEDIDEDDGDDDDAIENAFLGRSTRVNESVSWNAAPTSASPFDATMDHGGAEQHRVDEDREDEDQMAKGLFQMMRRAAALRRMQRWFRMVLFTKHSAAARVLQRAGRGLRARRAVGAIPVRGDNGVMVSRGLLHVTRMQRVGRAFLCRRLMAQQFVIETFDRDIGRFASHMALTACLTVPSEKQVAAKRQLQQQQQAAAVSSSSPNVLLSRRISSTSSRSSMSRQHHQQLQSPSLQPANSFTLGGRKQSFAASSPVAGIADATSPWGSPASPPLLYPDFGSPVMMSHHTEPFIGASSALRTSSGLAADNSGGAGGVSPSQINGRRRGDLVRYAYAAKAAQEERDAQQANAAHVADGCVLETQGESSGAVQVSPGRDAQAAAHYSPFFTRSRLRRNAEQNAALQEQAAASQAGEEAARRRAALKWHKPERLVFAASPTAEEKRLLRFVNVSKKAQGATPATF